VAAPVGFRKEPAAQQYPCETRCAQADPSGYPPVNMRNIPENRSFFFHFCAENIPQNRCSMRNIQWYPLDVGMKTSIGCRDASGYPLVFLSLSILIYFLSQTNYVACHSSSFYQILS